MRLGANKVKVSEEIYLSDHLILKKNLRKDEGSDSEYHISRQQEAVIYGKSTFLRPDKKASLTKESSFEVGFADFLNAPFIDILDFCNFSGQPGSQLFITIQADYFATSVIVKIETSDGLIVHEGLASQGLFASEWAFFIRQNPTGLVGNKITVTASG